MGSFRNWRIPVVKLELSAMSEENQKRQKSPEELRNAIRISIVTAAGVIFTAILSAVVSFFVSNQTLVVEVEKIRSQESLERAKIFQNLVQISKSSDDPTLALLALWKVYPDDKELIVTTALLNPTPQTVGALHALGVGDELHKYDRLISSVMLNASYDKVREFSELYADFSPETVLRINLQSIDRARQNVKVRLAGLEKLINQDPNLSSLLVKIFDDDFGNRMSPKTKAQVARLAYDTSPGLFEKMLDESEVNEDLYYELATEFRRYAEILDINDQRRMVDTSFIYLEKFFEANEAIDDDMQAYIELIAAIFSDSEASPDERSQFSDFLERVFTSSVQRGRPYVRALLFMHERTDSLELARKLYYRTIFCSEVRTGRNFFGGFPERELALEAYSETKGYDEMREIAKSRLDSSFKCETWL